MTKEKNQKVPATDNIRKLSGALTNAKVRRKEWKNAEDKLIDAIKAEAGAADVTFVTSRGDEVVSITETAPIHRYDYAKYFADHPAEFVALQAGYTTSVSTQTRVTTNWIEEP